MSCGKEVDIQGEFCDMHREVTIEDRINRLEKISKYQDKQLLAITEMIIVLKRQQIPKGDIDTIFPKTPDDLPPQERESLDEP